MKKFLAVFIITIAAVSCAAHTNDSEPDTEMTSVSVSETDNEITSTEVTEPETEVTSTSAEVTEPYTKEVIDNSENYVNPLIGILSDEEMEIYNALYDGIMEKSSIIVLPHEISGDTYGKFYRILSMQNSEFFYLARSYRRSETMKCAMMEYNEESDIIDMRMNELNEITENIINNAPYGDYEKALYIHDYIIEHCNYNIESDNNYNIYGTLVEGQALCEGYAKAFCYLAKILGLQCVCISGDATNSNGETEGHGWNQVKIADEWYNVDVTWDDPIYENGNGNIITWDYFLCNDEEFYKNHTVDLNETYFSPFKCTSTEYNYFMVNGLFASDVSEANTIVKRELADGNNEIRLKFANFQAYSDFYDSIYNSELYGVIREVNYFSDKTLRICDVMREDNIYRISFTLVVEDE